MEERSRLGIVLLVGTIVVGLYLARDANLNRPAPMFTLPTTYGTWVNLESYRGQPVLLVFWATSCGICQHELPLLNNLAPDFQSKGISIVAIHFRGKDDAAAYMRDNHINLTSLVDNEGTVWQAYHVNGVPKLVLIGSDGKVKRTSSGWTDKSVLRKWMKAAGGS